MHPSAVFRCFMSNSETEPFIQSKGIDCSSSLNDDQVQVLSDSKYFLLFTWS